MGELRDSTAGGVLDALPADPPPRRPLLWPLGFPRTGLVWQRQTALAVHGDRVVAPNSADSPGPAPDGPAPALNRYRAGRPDGAIAVIDVSTPYVRDTGDSTFGPAAAQETGQRVTDRTGSRPFGASATGSPRRRPRR